jgi:hypothetical protein
MTGVGARRVRRRDMSPNTRNSDMMRMLPVLVAGFLATGCNSDFYFLVKIPDLCDDDKTSMLRLENSNRLGLSSQLSRHVAV